jgi:hypothetical protein
MNKEFIPYAEALVLKELGFDEPCFGYYVIPEIQRTGEIILHYCSRGKEILKNNDWSWVYANFPSFRRYLKPEHCYRYSTNSSKLLVSAPLYQQAFRWFREKYSLVIQYIPREIDDSEGQSIIHHKYKISEYDSWRGGRRNTVETELNEDYEEAELECLKKLINICKK